MQLPEGCINTPLLRYIYRLLAQTTRWQRAYITLWATLVLLWWASTHTLQFCRSTGLCDCPGPVLKPSPRPEPWCQSFNRKLAQEVAQNDAGKASGAIALLHATRIARMCCAARWLQCHATYACATSGGTTYQAMDDSLQ